MMEYLFNDELNILEVNVSGKIYITDTINHYFHLSETYSFHNKLNVLIDSCDAIFDIKPDEIRKVLKPLLKTISKYNHLHEAIIVDNPYKTAIATLFENQYMNFKNYKFNVFSTKEAALNWLSRANMNFVDPIKHS